jgi:enoyl-CoA hydratase/carnithine racemase
MTWRDRSDITPRKLFTTEETDGVVILTFCNEAHDLLGMDLAMIDQLWSFFAAQERHPAKAIVLIAPPSILGPAGIDRLLAAHGIHGAAESCDEASTPAQSRTLDFIREENGFKRFTAAVRNTDAFVIAGLSGAIVLPLLGPLLSCDFRVAATDLVIVNRMVDWLVAPVGGLPWHLTALLGRREAGEVVQSDLAIQASEALQRGLVDRVVPAERMRDTCIDVARGIAARPWGNRAALKQVSSATGERLEDYLAREEGILEKALARIPTEPRPT